MSKRLIVNADDYGRTQEVSRGIRFSHSNGIVTSTTVMMNMPKVEVDLQLALAETPNLGLGVHLVLTSGRPVMSPEQVPSLVQPNGIFHNLSQFTTLRKQIILKDVQAEWQAQVGKFVSITGRNPTHFDSHHHSSYFTREIFQNMLELARQYGAAIRMATVQKNVPVPIGMPDDVTMEAVQFAPELIETYGPAHCDDFCATFYDEAATLEELVSIIRSLPAGTHELMCHPGYSDSELEAGSIYNQQRNSELGALTAPQVKAAIQECGIQLIHYGQL
jgi:chitin disaccharide deacetylase